MERMNRGKKNLIIVFLFLLLFLSFTTFSDLNSISRADSGWDSSYDSGGWDSGDSSWSSGGDYSWDTSDNWSTTDYHSTRSYGKVGVKDKVGQIIFMLFFLIITITLPLILKDLKNPKGGKVRVRNTPDKYDGKLSKYEEFMANYDNIIKGLDNGKGLDTVEDHEIKEILPNETRESLIDKLYNKFVEIQKAWMNFDYDKLRELCTDELYNTYYSQLEALKLKNGKNIMDNFELIVADIIGLEKDDNYITVTMLLKAAFNDFVINAKTKKVIKGRDDYLMNNTYNLVFVIGNGETDDTCPNCGAKIKNTISGKCEFCGSDVVIKPKDYVLAKKTIIS